MPKRGRPQAPLLRDSVHRALVTRIRGLTERRGWTLTQLAGFSGLGTGYVSNFLARKKSPTVRTLLKIAKALDVRVADLFT